MRETDVVSLIQSLANGSPKNRKLLRGIGDDCAVLRASAKYDWVFTTDFLLEGRHFETSTHSASAIGHKALARSLSDLAAMGAEPLFCLVSLAIPPALASSWVKQFYDGLLGLAAEFRISLAGGDLAQFDRVLVDVMCCGQVPHGKALLRSGAKPGDAIYVTGELGASARGFRTRRGAHWKRHRNPQPRVAAGLALRKLGVTSCMDLSDGLSLDLARLCKVSGVAADLSTNLPMAKDVTLTDALHGGEDYELLFTAPQSKRIPKAIAGIPATCIGIIVEGKPGSIRFCGKRLRPQGFDHFSAS